MLESGAECRDRHVQGLASILDEWGPRRLHRSRSNPNPPETRARRRVSTASLPPSIVPTVTFLPRKMPTLANPLSELVEIFAEQAAG